MKYNSGELKCLSWLVRSAIYRDCFFANAEPWYEEVIQKSCDGYSPYSYIEEQDQDIYSNDCDVVNFDWDDNG